MIAQSIPRLTEREKDQVTKEWLEAERRKFLTVLDAMGTDSRWFKFFVNRDYLEMGTEIDKLLWNYLDKCGDFETARSEAQIRKELE